jgi:beta-N-acetylhexosaminidase|tara:strand:+ start:1696 stop:2736 length:1041 start_codon:yes stop_codon:yes gene_type:complete
MSKSIEQLVGQIIIAGFRGKALEKDSDIARYVTEFNIGGVILYDEDLEIGGDGTRNIESPKQVKKLVSQLQDLSEHPLLISVDQEGGQVHRLKSVYGFEETPSWQHIGVLNDPLMTEQFAKTMASTLSGLGINLNFAPVLDLDHGQDTVISDSERAFSTDTQAIIEHSKIFIEQHKREKIITCGKHFPGLGSASGDTHEGFTDISDTWSVKDLIPFDEMIQSGDLEMIMVSHAFDTKLDQDFPSSLSKKIVTEMLRNDLGFSGPVICDDPSMRAISDHYDLHDTFELMINAGIDLFCLGNNLIYDPDYIPRSIGVICDLIRDGKITEKRITESIDRVNKIKKRYNV